MCAHAGGLGAVKKIKAALRKSHSGPDLRNTDERVPEVRVERERERERGMCVCLKPGTGARL